MAALWKGLVAHEVSVPWNFKKWFVEFERCTVNFAWSKSVCDSIQVAVFLGLKMFPHDIIPRWFPIFVPLPGVAEDLEDDDCYPRPFSCRNRFWGSFWAEAESKWMETLGKCKSNSGTLMHFQACFTTSKHFPSIFPMWMDDLNPCSTKNIFSRIFVGCSKK